jgi:hypothetical protein
MTIRIVIADDHPIEKMGVRSRAEQIAHCNARGIA